MGPWGALDFRGSKYLLTENEGPQGGGPRFQRNRNRKFHWKSTIRDKFIIFEIKFYSCSVKLYNFTWNNGYSIDTIK